MSRAGRARKRSARPPDSPAGSRSYRPGCCRAGPGSAGSRRRGHGQSPARRPLGEASARPEASVEAMTRNGDSAIKARECFSSRGNCFLTARSRRFAVQFADLANILDNVHPRLLSRFAPSMHDDSGNLQAETRGMAVLVARDARPEGGYVARITIDNAAKLNTINRALAVEIVETITAVRGRFGAAPRDPDRRRRARLCRRRRPQRIGASRPEQRRASSSR